ncbi:hypothetical protein SEA_RASPUTIA_84 [Microbacterium phage Rasputia]|nr:hypothetical protein SEA_RASPUTIA_84 [Microbacterium phage Rasputia]
MSAESTQSIAASIPEEIRQRIGAAAEMQRVADALGVGSRPAPPRKKLSYAEPSNCALHFLSPSQIVAPSFATVAGLSLCPDCTVRAAALIVNERLSTAEMIEHAMMGIWLDEDLEGESPVL